VLATSTLSRCVSDTFGILVVSVCTALLSAAGSNPVANNFMTCLAVVNLMEALFFPAKTKHATRGRLHTGITSKHCWTSTLSPASQAYSWSPFQWHAYSERAEGVRRGQRLLARHTHSFRPRAVARADIHAASLNVLYSTPSSANAHILEPPPPWQSPPLARYGLPGGWGGGRQVTVSQGGGGLQGYCKAWG
jgi:hypothetical protein